MSEFIEFLIDFKDNRTFICALLFLFFSLGLFAFYGSCAKPIFVLLAIFCSFLILALFLVKNLQRVFSYSFVFILFLISVFGFFNAKFHEASKDEFSSIPYAKNVQLTGTITSIPNYNSSTRTYKFQFVPNKVAFKEKSFEISKAKVLGVIKSESDEKLSLKFGDKILLRGSLSTPFAATNPSQFDYRNFLKRKGMLKAFYSSDLDFELLESPSFSRLFSPDFKGSRISYATLCILRLMNDVRDNAIYKHSKYLKSPRLEILGGVVFGDDAVNPPDEVRGSFINSGLLHLLAASGLNVALILSIWLCLIHFIDIPYKIKILSGIFIVFLYTLMTGFPPSIVRASVMLILMLIGKLLYRKADGAALIFMAGLLILIFKPQFLCDVGFQLSFLVTFGLIVCTPCVMRLVESYNMDFISNIKDYPKFCKSFLLMFSPASLICCVLIPFIAQIWAAPLQAFYFNTFSLYSVPANIAVVPFIGIVSFLGFISTAFCFIPFVSDIILPVTDFILNTIIQIVLNISNFFSALPYSLIDVPAPSVFQICLFYAFIVLFFFSLKKLFKKKILNYALMFFLLSLVLSSIRFLDTDSSVIFFDVANADNILIKTPKNKYIMIDTGRSVYSGNSTAKTITLEYMLDNNIKELDTLIVTHYDSDHSGGLVDILKKIRVKNLVIPKPECTSKNSCEILKYIKSNKIPYILPYSGQTFYYEPDVKVINYVPSVKTFSSDSRNDSSTVTLVDFGNQKFLFMADVPIGAYETIKDMLPDNINVLKSAHHGAKYTVNIEMLDKLSPDYSVLSTGRNPYGHPDSETVELLSEYSQVLSTKNLGAIKFKITNELEVYSFDSKSRKFKKLFR